MPEEHTTCGGVRESCAHAFKEIAGLTGRMEDAVCRIEARLTELSRAVIGNGDYRRGLAAEVQRQALYWRIVKVVLLSIPPAAGIVFGIVQWLS